MILQKLRPVAVGYLRIIFSGLLFILASLNLTTNIKADETLIEILLMSLPFYLLSISMFYMSNTKAISLVCLIAALYSSFNQNVIGDYSASIFYIFSFHVTKNKKYGLLLIILSILSISINSIIIDSRLAITIALFVAYTTVYIIYYYFILKPIENKYNLNFATRSEEEKAILKLYAKGYTYAKISKTLGLNVTDVTIRRKIKAVKKDSGCKNDVQFGQWLFGNV